MFPTPHLGAQVGELRVEARWLQEHDTPTAERQKGSAASRDQHAQAHGQPLAATVTVFPEPSTRSASQQDGKLCCEVVSPRAARHRCACCRLRGSAPTSPQCKQEHNADEGEHIRCLKPPGACPPAYQHKPATSLSTARPGAERTHAPTRPPSEKAAEDPSAEALQELISRGVRLREQLARANADLLVGGDTNAWIDEGNQSRQEERRGLTSDDESLEDSSSLLSDDSLGASLDFPEALQALLSRNSGRGHQLASQEGGRSMLNADAEDLSSDDIDGTPDTTPVRGAFVPSRPRADAAPPATSAGSATPPRVASREKRANADRYGVMRGASPGRSAAQASSGKPDAMPTPGAEAKDEAALHGSASTPLDVRQLTQLGRVTRIVVHVHALEATSSAGVLLDDDLAGDLSLELSLPGQGLNPNSWQPQATHVLRFETNDQRRSGLAFDQRVELPVRFDDQSVAAWQRAVVIFRLLAARPHAGSEERGATSQPDGPRQLLGLASLRLSDVLTASGLRLDAALPLVGLPSALSHDRETHTDTEDGVSAELGTLHVTFHLQTPEQADTRDGAGRSAAATSLAHDAANKTEAHGQSGPVLSQPSLYSQTTGADDDAPDTPSPGRPVHFFLLVQEAKGVPARGLDSATPGASRNLYVISRLPASAEPGRSQVVWNTNRPELQHQHAVPAFITQQLLQQLRSGFCVVEVWDRCGNRDATDALIGLVKVPTTDLYLSLQDASVAAAILRSDLPIVCCNGLRPIVDPVTGGTRGQARLLLAAGSQRQVAMLARHGAGPQPGVPASMAGEAPLLHADSEASLPPGVRFATKGPQPLRRDVSDSDDGANSQDTGGREAASNSAESDRKDEGLSAAVEQQRARLTEHRLELIIPHARNLDVFGDTLYGEADCYIQYVFPETGAAQLEAIYSRAGHGDMDGGGTTSQRRETRSQPVLCLPNAALDHKRTHMLVAGPREELADVLLPHLEEGLQIALYKRRYYPNVRDEHIATADLPASQLRSFAIAAAHQAPLKQQWTLKLFPADCPSHLSGVREIGTLAVELACRSAAHQPTPELSRILDAAQRRLVEQAGFGSDQESAETMGVSVQLKRATGLRAALRGAARALGHHDLSLANDVGPAVYFRLALAHKTATHGGDGHTAEKSDSSAGIWAQDRASEWVRTSAQARSFAPDIDEAVRLQGAGRSLLVEVWLQSTDDEGPGRQPDVLLATGAVPLRGLATLPYEEIPLWCTLHGAGAGVNRRDGRGAPARVAGCLQLGLTLEQPPASLCSHIPAIIHNDALLGCQCQLQLIAEDVHLPAATPSVDASTRRRLWSNSLFYIRYVLPDGRVQRSSASAMGDPVAGLPGNVVNLQHRAMTTFVLTPAAALALAGQLELQLWCRPVVQAGASSVPQRSEHLERAEDDVMGRDDAGPEDEWVGSAFVDTHALLQGRVSISAHAPLIRPYAADLGDGWLRTHVLIDIVGHNRGHERDGSGRVWGEHVNTAAPHPGEDSAQAAEGEDGESRASHEVYVTVERALHLHTRTGGLDRPLPSIARSYVSYGIGRSLVCTQLASGGSCPVWEHKRAMRVVISREDHRCSSLVFRVWYRNEDPAGLPAARPSSPENGPGAASQERLLGQATVDLVPLALGLSTLEGWYHVQGASGETVGQILVAVKLLRAYEEQRGTTETPAHRDMRTESGVDDPRPLHAGAAPGAGRTETQWRPPLDPARAPAGMSRQEFFGSGGRDIAADLPSPPSELSSSFLRQKLQRNLSDLDSIRSGLSLRTMGGARGASGEGHKATPLSHDAAEVSAAASNDHSILERSRQLLSRLRSQEQAREDGDREHNSWRNDADSAARMFSPRDGGNAHAEARERPSAHPASHNLTPRQDSQARASWAAEPRQEGHDIWRTQSAIGADARDEGRASPADRASGRGYQQHWDDLLDDVDEELDISTLSSLTVSPSTPRRVPPRAPAALPKSPGDALPSVDRGSGKGEREAAAASRSGARDDESDAESRMRAEGNHLQGETPFASVSQNHLKYFFSRSAESLRSSCPWQRFAPRVSFSHIFQVLIHFSFCPSPVVSRA